MNGIAKFSQLSPALIEHGRDATILLGLGVFLSAIGAFDTNGAEFGRRLAYWLVLMATGGIIHALLEPALAKRNLGGGVWRKSTLLAIIMTVPLTPLVWLVSALIFGAALSPGRLAELVPGVLVVNGAFVGLLGVTNPRQSPPHALPLKPGAIASVNNAIPVIIRDQIPTHLRNAALYALQAEDHYVRVHTSAGTALIRIKMRDAIAAADPAMGFQTHRSWWVSEAAICTVRWKRGRAILRLKNEIDVPVSRSFAKNLVQSKRL